MGQMYSRPIYNLAPKAKASRVRRARFCGDGLRHEKVLEGRVWDKAPLTYCVSSVLP